ncbi:DNA-processing protein DprA [Paraburkholderia caribensis]|uniref:DNA processing protein DprA n=1 Tax=Paraburkholderia caribensis TaxID=75105 RepID=A0A9Q6S0F2_9BURK|nr:DNA-processing protein DprA [Paraburkholderia caribensis]MCO4875568.1 DNA-protecting protein DprA [Paraburkholderia caribensis]PTB30513.1 DNA-processing protein DprA [Paraburkholderia caribensis]QLB62246.1 DNA processing protein DprA [Paraburkholderia caribensis]
MTSLTTKKLLALSLLKGVGPAALRSSLAVPDFVNSSIEAITSSVPRIGTALKTSAGVWNAALDSAERQVEAAASIGARIISVVDAEYPPLLRMTKDDPVILYVHGRLMPESTHSVAIIGTREPTRHGGIIADRISRFYVEHGWSVVSGLAIGCDTIAHQAALDAGGHTVAVLAHGLHTVSPAQNRRLAEDILSKGGALVSEYPFGRAPSAPQFVKRDRIQAGLAQGVVMIQSDLRGGSLHASRAAMNYGRWLAVPYPTERDISQQEQKIQANLLLADQGSGAISELLQCPTSALERIVIVRGREDYSSLLCEGVSPPDARPFDQGSLL